jgi:hypothetical protein
MKSNITQTRNFKAGSPKSTLLKTTNKRFSPILASNYKVVLQLYCVNRKKAIKKELKCERVSSHIAHKSISTPSFSIFAWMTPFFTVNVALFKKLRQGIALVTE